MEPLTEKEKPVPEEVELWIDHQLELLTVFNSGEIEVGKAIAIAMYNKRQEEVSMYLGVVDAALTTSDKLRAELNMLHGKPFSRRAYIAMESQLNSLSASAEAWEKKCHRTEVELVSAKTEAAFNASVISDLKNKANAFFKEAEVYRTALEIYALTEMKYTAQRALEKFKK